MSIAGVTREGIERIDVFTAGDPDNAGRQAERIIRAWLEQTHESLQDGGIGVDDASEVVDAVEVSTMREPHQTTCRGRCRRWCAR